MPGGGVPGTDLFGAVPGTDLFGGAVLVRCRAPTYLTILCLVRCRAPTYLTILGVVPGTDLFKTAVKYIPEGPASRDGRTAPVAR